MNTNEAGALSVMEAPISTRPHAGMMQTAGAQALVQRSLAEVQVAVMMAKQFPRDKIGSKEKLMMDCCREGLAAVAVYSYSRGGSEITGPTIRLAEAIKNAWGNMQSGWREISRSKGVDGVGISEVETFAWDTENNTRESTSITVRHWRDTKKGGYPLVDERDIKELLANQAKRLERGCILNIVDGDMVEAALAQCNTTLTTQVKVTPERIAAMVGMFKDEYSVSKEQIEKRIQRRIDTINAPLMISLTKIYNSLKDGMSKSADWFEAEAIAGDDEKQTKTDEIKNKLKKSAKQSEHDPLTGEITDTVAAQNKEATESTPEPMQPTAIPAKALPGDATKTDWVTWAQNWNNAIAGMTDIQSLKKLKKLNEGILSNFEKIEPEQFKVCIKFFATRMSMLDDSNVAGA